jgi:hypothetical protein
MAQALAQRVWEVNSRKADSSLYALRGHVVGTIWLKSDEITVSELKDERWIQLTPEDTIASMPPTSSWNPTPSASSAL